MLKNIKLKAFQNGRLFFAPTPKGEKGTINNNKKQIFLSPSQVDLG